MRKYTGQIIHWFVLLIIGVALIGVNVTRFSCSHAGEVYWEVKILPAEKDCPCHSDCPCCGGFEKKVCEDCCHAGSLHAFYKITELSEVERLIELHSWVFEIPVVFSCLAGDVIYREDPVYPFLPETPELPPSQESLCTYRC